MLIMFHKDGRQKLDGEGDTDVEFEIYNQILTMAIVVQLYGFLFRNVLNNAPR